MRKYVIEMAAALLCYLVALIASMAALAHHQDSEMITRAAISLTPIIPAGLLCWVVIRQLRRLDELHLRIQLEALGFAFAASALMTFSYGFMENIGAPHIPWFWVWPVMALMWMLGLGIARRRYQ